MLPAGGSSGVVTEAGGSAGGVTVAEAGGLAGGVTVAEAGGLAAVGVTAATGAGVAAAAPLPIAAFNSATLANPILAAASVGLSQVTLVPILLTNGSAKHLRSPLQALTMNFPLTHCAKLPLIQAFGCLFWSQVEVLERPLKLLFRLMASGML